jgi:hypothetical protein
MGEEVMIKICSGILAVTLAGAGLTACAGMDGGSPRPDMVMTQTGGFAPSNQVLEESRCSMQENQGLVGTNLSAMAPATSRTARIVPMATRLDQQPTVPSRLTVLYNPANNMITEVRCG